MSNSSIDFFSVSLELESCTRKIKQRFLSEDSISQEEFDKVLKTIDDLKAVLSKIENKNKDMREF